MNWDSLKDLSSELEISDGKLVSKKWNFTIPLDNTKEILNFLLMYYNISYNLITEKFQSGRTYGNLFKWCIGNDTFCFRHHGEFDHEKWIKLTTSDCYGRAEDVTVTPYGHAFLTIDDYKECSDCHKLIPSYTSGSICPACKHDRNDEIAQYHDHHGSLTHCFNPDEQPFNPETFKGYGVELEMECHDQSNQDIYRYIRSKLGNFVYGEYDGSLVNGVEMITYPATKEALFNKDFKSLFTYLIEKGVRSYTGGDCGMHIHASRTLFGDNYEEQCNNIAKLLFFITYYWNNFKKFSRRTNFSYCENMFYSSQTLDKDTAEKKAKNECDSPRGALNLGNKYTVEFRLPRGTLNYNTWRANIDLYDRLIANSKNIDWTDITNKDKWLEGIEENTKNYIEKRHMFDDERAKRCVGEY